jgi:hypothetical protein
MPDKQKYHMRMPRNRRESIAFMLIISLISVNIIPVLISGLTTGFSLEMWRNLLIILPILWFTVILVVLLVREPATMLADKIVCPTDSFNAHIVINTLCSVFMVSIILTVVGTWIGGRHISIEPIVHFFEIWPRNFAIAFFVEILLAQPVARLVMHHYHTRIDTRS